MEEQHNSTTEPETPHPPASADAELHNGVLDDDADLHPMAHFLNDPAHDYRNLQYGDTVDGTIVRIDKDGILVDIGVKAEGIIPYREMQSLSEPERTALQVGETLLLFVLQAEHKEGFATLSIDRARQERSWRRLQAIYEAGEPLHAPVVNYNKGGLLVNLEGVRGFIPASQVTSISRSTDTQKQSDMARLVGEELLVKVIEMSRDRNRLILSERQAVQEQREEKKEELLSTLHEGAIHRGTISSVCDFGVFVDIGGADGLVHLSELSWGRVRHPSEILAVGTTVDVAIMSIDRQRKRIALSIKRTQREPWATVGERYQLNEVIESTITQIATFGAFARIEDGVEGLIHISELGDEPVQNPREVVSEGDVVTVRIIRIDPARKRIGLSKRLHTDAAPPAHRGANPADQANADDTDTPDETETPDT